MRNEIINTVHDVGEVFRILKRIVLLLLTMLSILFSATCFAHTMPESEMFLRGVGPKTTLAQVKAIYGEPAGKDEFKGEGVRVVTYVYSPLFKVFGRTYARFFGGNAVSGSSEKVRTRGKVYRL